MSNSTSRSLHVGTFAGIPVKIHWTFGFLVLFFLYIGYQDKLTLSGFLWLGVTVVSLFTCVVLHEYGHALTARRFGIRTADILLTPIGGIARLKGMPKKPMQEFLIAIAGPLVNIFLMIVAGVYLFFTIDVNSGELLENLIIIDSFPELVLYLFFLNFVLFAFNLIPAFPMDGGRILRSLLSLKMDRKKATMIASVTGRILAVIFIILAVIYNQFSLGFIGVFVFIMAQKEYKVVKMEDAIEKATARSILRVNYNYFLSTDPISKALELFKAGNEKSFLVLNPFHQVEGVLHELFLSNIPSNIDTADPIRQITSPRFELIHPGLSLKQLFDLMQNKGYSILPVVENGSIIGVVDRKDVMNFIKSMQ